MILIIVNKILMTLFFMSCLTTIRHAYYFLQAYFTSTEEEPIKYKVSTSSLILLCASIGFILSTIFTGITI